MFGSFKIINLLYTYTTVTHAHTLTYIYYRTYSIFTIMQMGVSEQFEQVLFNVRPMRLTLKIYDALRWCRSHPGLTASLSLALPVAAALGTAITVKLLTR